MQEVALTTSESDSADREVLLELNRNYVRSVTRSFSAHTNKLSLSHKFIPTKNAAI
jgi:hypothetical protein